MRARKETKEKKLTKTTRNMKLAKAFSDGVDDIISAKNEIFAFGVGTMVFMAILIALQFIPVANWVGDGALFIINLITGGGIFKDTVNLAIAIYHYYMASKSADVAFNKL